MFLIFLRVSLTLKFVFAFSDVCDKLAHKSNVIQRYKIFTLKYNKTLFVF